MISLSDVSESYDFFTGVPDSVLKPFSSFIENYKYSNKYNKKNLKIKYNYLDLDK